MRPIRCAVVGAGHLGKIHARILNSLAEFELSVIVDPSEAARNQAAETFRVPVAADYRDWLDRVDAVVIASPTKFHHRAASDSLLAGKQTFVEKPLTASVAEAEELVDAARRRRVVLQVGHVERFNPVWRATRDRWATPRLIEARREGPFSFRSTDIGVVYDLMIHDLDLIASLLGEPVVDVEASGANWLGKHEDTAYARLRFAGGCTAIVQASRVASSPVRQMRIRTDRETATLDFQTRTAQITLVDERLRRGDVDVERMSTDERLALKERLSTEYLRTETIEAPAADAITAELLDFAEAIRHGRRPIVSGSDALTAVRIAEQILEALAAESSEHSAERHIIPAPHWRTAVDAAQRHREAG